VICSGAQLGALIVFDFIGPVRASSIVPRLEKDLWKWGTEIPRDQHLDGEKKRGGCADDVIEKPTGQRKRTEHWPRLYFILVLPLRHPQVSGGGDWRSMNSGAIASGEMSTRSTPVVRKSAEGTDS
jgi:hypothetical protein